MVVPWDVRDLCLDSSFESNSPSYRCLAFCFLSLGLRVLLVLFHYGMRGAFKDFVLNVNGILRWQEYILVLVPFHMNYFSNRVVIKTSSKSQLQKCWCWLLDYWDWKKNVAFNETFSPNTILNEKTLKRGEEKGKFNTTECSIFYLKSSEQDILPLF